MPNFPSDGANRHQNRRQPLQSCAGRRNVSIWRPLPGTNECKGAPVNSIIYLVGLVVIVMFILSFVGLR